jgi:hypothetical protein
MRTKALLLGAMIGAASLATSMAQVYSVNIVGYVNVTIPHGFSIIANPLNVTGGNTLANVMATPPQGVIIYKFRNSTGTYLNNVYDAEFGAWDDDQMTVNPGEGFFVYNPGSAFTVTFVGEVATGPTSVPLVVGFNMIASKVPQTGLIQTDLNYVPDAGGETIYRYRVATGDYGIYSYDPDFSEWDEQPSINVGEGFWAYRRAHGGSWDRTFNVGP